MKGRIITILFLIAAGFILTTTVKYLPSPFRALGVLVFALICMSLALARVYKKRVSGALHQSPAGKIMNNIIFFSAFGVIAALILRVLHLPFGRLLLNFSLGLCLVGILGAIFASPIANINVPAPVAKRQNIFAKAIYTCAFCMVSGMLLKVNHYPCGKMIMFCGLFATFAFLLFVIIYGTYASKKMSS